MTIGVEASASLDQGPPDDAAALLAMMLRIRMFEDKVMDLFSQNLVRGSTHLCQGQEAVTVGVCSVLRHVDTMTCTYRGHGAVIAKGAPLAACFGELLGRAGGLCRGKGGSMHFADFSVGAIGSNAIVGAHLPITVGAALASSYLGDDRVAVSFFGDGATNIGAFHEALNLASVWKLPAVFVIENNQYGEYSPLRSTTPIDRLARRADAYGMPGVLVDGNDVAAVRSVARSAVERARAGQGPTLIEADTYRQVGHSRSDPATYRPAGELDRWLERDPILLLERSMLTRWSTEELDTIRQTAQRDVDSALEMALAMPEPTLDEMAKDVWA
ncbi:MAG: thiamine pyrophosphate-dependent dehydrogenase E1 component subunit alpha [Actinomycetota bacterium]|nr:thiamine pyrophosphate-dependent dehydrogenase E1 component subunit alpha [Actinomycetota bacterium]